MFKKVKYAKLHGGDAFLPTLGINLGNTLPPSNKTLEGLVMYFTDHGLMVEYRKTAAIIPSANVQIAVFEESELLSKRVSKPAPEDSNAA